MEKTVYCMVWGPQVSFLPFADDAMLLASSSHNLHGGSFQQLRVGISKSMTMVLSLKKVECCIWVVDQGFPQEHVFKYFYVLFMVGGWIVWEMTWQFGASSLMLSPCVQK